MGNTYEYMGIDNSLTLQITAGAEIKDAQCKAVTFQDGKAALPSAGGVPIGILLLSLDDSLAEGAEGFGRPGPRLLQETCWQQTQMDYARRPPLGSIFMPGH